MAALRQDPGAPAARAAGAFPWALVAFVGLAYVLSWSWAVPLAAGHQVVEAGRGRPTHTPALFGPAVAAVVVLAATTGRRGVADLLRRVVRWRVGWRWWAVAVSPVVFLGIALLGILATGGAQPDLAGLGAFSGIPAAFGLPVVALLITLCALGEEAGWRGYLLPGLQRRLDPLVASLVVAPVWALWHLPQFAVIATYRGFGIVRGVGFVLGLTCGAVVLTWLYNRTGGSVLLVTVWHGVYNVVGGTRAATGTVAAVVSTLVMAQALVLIGLHLRARRTGRPSPLAPREGPEVPAGGDARPWPSRRRAT